MVLKGLRLKSCFYLPLYWIENFSGEYTTATFKKQEILWTEKQN
jgi:hypothetical protein